MRTLVCVSLVLGCQAAQIGEQTGESVGLRQAPSGTEASRFAALVSGTTQWQRGIGSIGDDTVMSMAPLSGGGFVATGYFGNTIDFGCGATVAPGGGTALFVAWFDAGGACTQVATAGSSSGVYGTSVAALADGGVIVTGAFQSNLSMAGQAFDSSGGYDLFVAKYAGDGTLAWVRVLGGAQDDYAIAVATDGTDAFVAGVMSGSVDFDGTVLDSQGDGDALVMRLRGADGKVSWATTFGGTGWDGAYAIAVDPLGFVAVGGVLHDKVDLGSGLVDGFGGADAFVARFDSDGAVQYARRYGGPGDDSISHVAFDGHGYLAAAGYFSSVADFGAGPLAGAGSSSAFVVKYDKAGNGQWSRAFAASTVSWAESVKSDPAGNLFVSGAFTGTANFGSGDVSSIGDTDAFVLALNADGTTAWSRTMGGQGEADAVSLVLLPGSLVAGGYFQTSIDPGQGALSGAGGFDMSFVSFLP